MSQDIFPFDLAICLGLPLFAASVGVAGIWLWRRLSMRGFQSAIPMDGATCLKADDGNILFKRRTGHNWLILVCLGGCLVAIGAGVVSVFQRIWVGESVSWGGLSTIIGATGIIVFAIRSTLRSMQLPPILFNTTSRLIDVGRGLTARQIPFSSLSRIGLASREGVLGSTAIDIQAILTNDEIIPLGSVSSSRAKAQARANTIAQLIADITFAPTRH